MDRPNLFEYATSELSQDAVLRWLFSWAHPESRQHDAKMHSVGTRLLRRVFERHNIEFPARIASVDAARQHEHIDVLVVVNGEIAIPVEDKTGTTEHSDQLKRYVAQLEQEGFRRNNILPVYVQTGDQGSFRTVREAGYIPILRKELLEVLTREGAVNSTLSDFVEHLQSRGRQIESYRHVPLSQWDSNAWQGFFSCLQEHIPSGEWKAVAHRGGSFLGFYWHSCPQGSDCEPYLQLEEQELCFKIWVSNPDQRARLKDLWHRRVMDGNPGHIKLVKPPRLKSGETITVARLEGDYRRSDNSGRLDLEATLGILRLAEKTLDEIVAR